LYNNALIESREVLGWNQGEAAKAIGVTASRLGRLENLKISPWGKRGGLRPVAEKVMNFYGLSEGVCYPPVLYGLPQTRFETLVSPDQLLEIEERLQQQYLLPSPEEAMEQTELKDGVTRLLASLTPRDEKVIRMRYGIGEDERTRQEAAEDLGVTKPMIDILERRALGKSRGRTRWPFDDHL
jgi:RNA polymerase sigma factor (sigma-70 family)